MSVKRVTVLLAAGLTLAGCNAGSGSRDASLELPDAYGEAGQLGSTTRPSTRGVASLPQWWTAFADPQLDSLVNRAVQRNHDLRLATARVIEARAQRGVVRADLFPTINATGSATRNRASQNMGGGFSGITIPGDMTGGGGGGGGGGIDHGGGHTGGGTTAGGASTGGTTTFGGVSSESSLFQAGFDAMWEIDVWGRVRREVEAADADIAAAVEDRRDVLVTLLSDVARNYIELRGLQRQLEIAQRNIRSQRETLSLTQSRFDAGLSGELDVARSRALVAESQSSLPVLETNIKASLHRLAVLLGEEPNALKDELTATQPIPVHGPEVPLGLPSDLLRRRPDVRRAERQLAAATARVGVATADLFPRFSLTGALGLQSDQLKSLGNWDSRFWSIGPSVSWPVLDFGRIRSNIRVQDARAEQALVTYQRSVLVALEDVENALVRYAKEQTRRQYLQEAVAANRRAVDLGQELYTRGLENFLSVLESQRQLFLAEDQLVQSEQLVASHLVALYKALGGGWQVEEPPADTRATVPLHSYGK